MNTYKIIFGLIKPGIFSNTEIQCCELVEEETAQKAVDLFNKKYKYEIDKISRFGCTGTIKDVIKID